MFQHKLTLYTSKILIEPNNCKISLQEGSVYCNMPVYVRICPYILASNRINVKIPLQYLLTSTTHICIQLSHSFSLSTTTSMLLIRPSFNIHTPLAWYHSSSFGSWVCKNATLVCIWSVFWKKARFLISDFRHANFVCSICIVLI